ncbi:MAG: UDP-N-acetylglucosamine 2-epimerase (non-hydrolyzing) [Anaerolineae bacterium]|nr:UDP-N-acetylglucosamine 2-epimerase (non-hydrolyzing) [Anaerolineae bacterium]MBN8618651.1 UDP-N-acetylglucosamine 2-epimerase (non-hydrolyzing) [Anaerolineae bacterium]
MKVMTVLGTRPEIIRLSLVIRLLDQHCDHLLVHTGQNYDPNLNDIFFRELGVRAPDVYLGIRASTIGEQIGRILIETEKEIRRFQPDRILILGDTNSGLVSIIARRMGIPVFHMEAGNRAFDPRMPEETNRKIIDHSSRILLPYTERSKENLLNEGIPGRFIYVTGNPIYEVIESFRPRLESLDTLARYTVQPQQYFLVTAHREENVDTESRLRSILTALDQIQQQYKVPVLYSLHPRTRDKMQKFGIQVTNPEVRLHEPMGFFDFINLELNALCVLTDSGTVQEECCIYRVRNVTLRDNTERPETVDCGSNILAGTDTDSILRTVKIVLENDTNWSIPPEYLERQVAQKVVRMLLSYLHEGLTT